VTCIALRFRDDNTSPKIPIAKRPPHRGRPL
jgi:hypothetical protein